MSSLLDRRLRARGLTPVNSVRWRKARNLGGDGLGNRARRTFGTGSASYVAYAKAPGTGGNAITFAVVVGGANTPASVSVTGTAITFNSATDAGSVGTSTAASMLGIVNSFGPARSLAHFQLALASDGTGVVAAQAATALIGAV